MFYQKIDTQKQLTNRGLVPISSPLPIPSPIPIPAPVPVQSPQPLPKPSVLPGTSTIDQYYTPEEEQPVDPAAVTGEFTLLTQQGTPAVGQYLPPPRRRRGSPGARAAAEREATRRALTELQAPPSVASNQISLPGPGRFWSNTAAARRVTLPRPEDIWRGVPTTSQITLSKPEDFWRR